MCYNVFRDEHIVGEMRIFNAFLIIVVSVFLFMLPIITAITDFRTDTREDNFALETVVGVVTGNVTLFQAIYNDNTNTIVLNSDDTDDAPTFSSYNVTTRLMGMTGLAASTNRTLTVSYLIDNFEDNDTLNTLMDRVPFLWLLVIVAFIPASLFAIFTGRA